MINVNKNTARRELESLLTRAIKDKSDNNSNRIELFKKRIFLEEILEETIYFNRKLNWEQTNENLRLVNTAEELIEVFKLRSDIYTDIGYQDEFPDTIEGLNFDKYDKNAAILFYETNSKITGSIRFIFDSATKLPTESKVSFDNLRNQYDTIGELSRLIVKKEKNTLSLEFKYLMQGVYHILMNNNIDITLLAIIKKHYKLYKRFGGTNIIQEMDDYGKLGQEMYLISLDPSLASNFFKRTFLR